MAAINWIHLGNGNWNQASDWSTDTVPGASDDATINLQGQLVVTSTGNVTVHRVTISEANLVIDRNTTFTATSGQLESGGITVNNGGFLVLGESGKSEIFENDADIDLDADTTESALLISGDVTLSGDGFISLSTPGGAGENFIGGIGSGSDTLILTGNLEGPGDFDLNTLTLTNQGLIGTGSGELNIGGTNTIDNQGQLVAFAGGVLVLSVPVNNTSGSIFASDGGVVEIGGGGAVSGGAVLLDGSDSTVELLGGGSVSGDVQYSGIGETLLLATGTNQVGGHIVGAVGGDNIDLAFVPFSTPDHLVWQQFGNVGGLSLVRNTNGSTIATLDFAGQYTSANFAAVSDNQGGTLIEVGPEPPNPVPPAGTTADMILRNSTSGNYEIYDLGMNAILAGFLLGQVGLKWQVAGLGGFDGSDTTDMMLRNSSSGAFEVYDISNNNITNSVAMGQVGLEWQVAGFGDFSSRAGETDMLMRNSNTGTLELYDIGNNTITSAAPMGQVGLEWSVAGFGDFSTRPNETDMLMRNKNTGVFELYDISNNQLISAAPMGQVGLEWSVAGFGDLSGSANETDMLMRNNNTGQFEIYDIRNNQITSAASMGQVGLEWSVAGFGPVNGAGTSDMLMRNNNTGAFEIYDISNNIITNAAPMGQVGLEWSVAGIAADPPGAPSAQLAQAMASYAPVGGAVGLPASSDQVVTQPTIVTAANSQSPLPG